MVRKMKFISDQAGIMNRYLREEKNWNAHLNNTREFILSSFQDDHIKKVAVLGSGWLLDLPLKELSKRFKKILLVDVYHPPQIVKKIEKYDNISLFETDLSGGGIKFCWDLRKAKEESFDQYILDKFEPRRPKLPMEPDAFISLNLLNQLDILLVEFLERKKINVIDIEVKRFREKIQQFHLDWISTKPCCIITDTLEMNNEDHIPREEQQPIHIPFPEGTRSPKWPWDFDLSGTYRPGKETRMMVKAIECSNS